MANEAAKISRAILQCVRACLESDAILAKIAQFSDKLREDPDWHESEIRLVEAGVRGMLKGLLVESKRGAPPSADARKIA